jgi:hypothetical protein
MQQIILITKSSNMADPFCPVEPPSYDEARLTAGCANLDSISASSDIIHFLDIARKQTGHPERIKAMFTATEAIFWVAASRLWEVDVLGHISRLLGAIAQYSYIYLQVYNVAVYRSRHNAQIDLQLLRFFDKWQLFIMEHPLLNKISIDVPPIRQITCDRARYENIIRMIQDQGFETIELGLDRQFITMLYGGPGARAGFPKPYEWTCPYREGSRRCVIRRLLKDAEIQAPERPDLLPSQRGWCNECGMLHRS